MWHLERQKSNELNYYANLFLKRIIKRINKCRNNPKYVVWCDYLCPQNGVDCDDSIIKEILISRPERLFSLNDKHLNGMLKKRQCAVNPNGFQYTYSERQLRHHLKAKAKKIANRTPREVTLVERYEELFEFLLYVFEYDMIKGDLAYEVAKMKEVNTCTYCNRLYTFTVGKSFARGITICKIRPQFDHWFAHKQYPMLSLSFYNLIPCCSVCNSSVKGSAHFSLKTHIHPYLSTTADPDFRFLPVLVYDEVKKDTRWSVILKCKSYGKEDNTIRDTALDVIYDRHGELEVKDIMDFAMKNNVTYLKDLFQKLCMDFQGAYSQSDIYRMLFGIEADIDHTLNRPFSKLKRDILKGEGIII